MAQSYEQHCALAHALDLVGERWTLLIVRELLAGPRRYADLADGLVSAPSNLLASRLRALEQHGLVRRRRLDPPATSVVVYELTDLGEALREPVVALARWGMRTLPPTRERRRFRAHWLAIGLEAGFEPAAAAGVEESYEFHIDGEILHLDVADGESSAATGPAQEPAVIVTADADTFLALSGGAIEPAQALARGARIDGDPAAIARMRALLPPRALPIPQSPSREGAPT